MPGRSKTMSVIASSFFDASQGAIACGLIVETVVLIAIAFSRSLTLGFFGGGLAGAIIVIGVLWQSHSIFMFLVLVVPVPIATLVGAAAGAAAAGLGKWIGRKFGKDPWDQL